MTDRQQTPETLEHNVSALVVEVTRCRQEAIALVEQIWPILATDLPTDTAPEDTFVGDAHFVLGQTEEICDLVKTEFEPSSGADAFEVTLALLQSLIENLKVVLAEVRNALSTLLEPVATGRAATRKALQTLLSRTQRLQHLCEVSQVERDKLAPKAKQLAAQQHWALGTVAVGEAKLMHMWAQVLQGKTDVKGAADAAQLTEQEQEAWQTHVLATASRVESELANVDFATEVMPFSEVNERDEDETFVVKLYSADPVALSDVVHLHLMVRNDHLHPLHLDSVDVEARFLKGFQLVDVRPRPKERRSEDGAASFEFDRDIQAGAAVTLVIRLRAKQSGNFSGEITVWTAGLASSSVMPNIDVVELH